ncbi:hypothetical protein [Ruegeria halocynthiae]|uniref:hypothetical protein n=1 Tax=Ruegeria halocynthiae TaxID=985054 RepID=UPI000AFEA6A2|nr:hypothetical protein [Ruegeria halocynthiae]
MVRITEFPEDGHSWTVVDIGPVERLKENENDITWQIKLRRFEHGEPIYKPVSVAAPLFRRIRLQSVWRAQKPATNMSPPKHWRIKFHGADSRIVWLRKWNGEIKILSSDPHDNSPPYVLAYCETNVVPVQSKYGGRVPVPIHSILIRPTEVIRHYLAKTDALARYMFDFSDNGGRNDHLFGRQKTGWFGNEYIFDPAGIYYDEHSLGQLVGTLSIRNLQRCLGDLSNRARADHINGVSHRPICKLLNSGQNDWLVEGDFRNLFDYNAGFDGPLTAFGVSVLLEDRNRPATPWGKGVHFKPIERSLSPRTPIGMPKTGLIPDAASISSDPSVSSRQAGGNHKKLAFEDDEFFDSSEPSIAPDEVVKRTGSSADPSHFRRPVADVIDQFSALSGSSGNMDVGKLGEPEHEKPRNTKESQDDEPKFEDRSHLPAIDTPFKLEPLDFAPTQEGEIPEHFWPFIGMGKAFQNGTEYDVSVSYFDSGRRLSLPHIPLSWDSRASCTHSPSGRRRALIIRHTISGYLGIPVYCWLFDIERRIKGEMAPVFFLTDSPSLLNHHAVQNILHYRISTENSGWPSEKTHDGPFRSYPVKHPSGSIRPEVSAANKLLNCLSRWSR